MKHIPVMKQIVKYNEVDVRVLYEIIDYLRKNHLEAGKSSETSTIRKRGRKEMQIVSTHESQETDDVSSPPPKRLKSSTKTLKQPRRSSSYEDKKESKRQKKSTKVLEKELSMVEEMNDSENATLATADMKSRYNLRKHKNRDKA